MNEIDRAQMRCAIDTLAVADHLLDGVREPEGDEFPPWKAAHFWIFRAMCLLLDSLNGVEEVRFSDEERVPVSITEQPYTHLANRHRNLSERDWEMVRAHEG